MKLKNVELFNTEEITSYISKFTAKLEGREKKIETLNAEIARLDADIDKAIEKDILEENAQSKKELANLIARKENVIAILNIEIEKLVKIKEIMAEGLKVFISRASEQIQKDLKTYNDTVEKDLFKKLQEIRQEQEQLLLLLLSARKSVMKEVNAYNSLCNFANLPEYRNMISHESFHNNLYLPNRSFAEFGSPLLQCNYLPMLEDILVRSRTNANSVYNNNREEKEQLPPAQSIQDIDIEKFLSELIKDDH